MKIIFKHSNRCPISVRAKSEMDNFLKNYPGEIEYEFIDVISNRDRSNEVAEVYGVTHESPQILIFDDHDKIIWTTSHNHITEKNIDDAVAGEI